MCFFQIEIFASKSVGPSFERRNQGAKVHESFTFVGTTAAQMWDKSAGRGHRVNSKDFPCTNCTSTAALSYVWSTSLNGATGATRTLGFPDIVYATSSDLSFSGRRLSNLRFLS